MLKNFMQNWVRGFCRSFRGQAARSSFKSTRLWVEQLEARWLPSTLTPAQVRHAYGVDRAVYSVNGQTVRGDGSGQTIAIVDAYHHPYAWRDLQAFDRQFGLPDPNFHQYRYGDTTDDGWAEETDLDVQWAHAIAPRANLLLIEAASNSDEDLYQAVNWVRQQPGVSVVSMSWGGSESSQDLQSNNLFTTPAGHQGITFVASAGDDGAEGLFPAMSPNVVAVGGTYLSVDAYGNYRSERAWTGTGGGYSNYESEPGYQYSVQNSGWRTGPDVAYNADPNSGVWVYATPPSTGRASWQSVGGTSAGTPQWAALFAIANQIRVAGHAHTLDGPSQTLYALYGSAMTGDFHDITAGSNGYSAHRGYDLTTGRGTPYAEKVILDLARVRDDFHGAVATSANTRAGAGTLTQLVHNRPMGVQTTDLAPAVRQVAGGDSSGVLGLWPSTSSIQSIPGLPSEGVSFRRLQERPENHQILETVLHRISDAGVAQLFSEAKTARSQRYLHPDPLDSLWAGEFGAGLPITNWSL